MTFTITADWNTGDINTRSTQACAVINDAGTPKIIAPIQHGVNCYSTTGTLLWSYSGITNGFDVRNIATADLTGSGYPDCSVVACGYYAGASRGQLAFLRPDGTAMQMVLSTDFATQPARCYDAEVDGTDIYVATDQGVTKFVKSGSTWAEDTTNWNKTIGACAKVLIGDAGNGKRIYVSQNSTGVLYCYQTNGTLDWSYTLGNAYNGPLVIARMDATKTGSQIVAPVQSSLVILDKDGALSASLTTGTNVRCSAICYDNDGDGYAELYYTDMGQHTYCYKNTAANTYTQQHLLASIPTTSTQYAGLAHFDINGDGADEIFIYTTDGYCYIYDKTLTTQIAALNIGHGQAGGYFSKDQFAGNGIVFADLNGDGHGDLTIAGATGYVDTFLTSGFTSTGVTATAANTLPKVTQSATGTFTPAPVTATATSTIPSITQSAAGDVPQVAYYSEPAYVTVSSTPIVPWLGTESARPWLGVGTVPWLGG